MTMAALISPQFKVMSLLPRQLNLSSYPCVRYASRFVPSGFKLPFFKRPQQSDKSTVEQLAEVAKSKEQAEKKEEEDLKKPSVKLKMLKDRYKDNPKQLMEFFDDYSNWGEDTVKTGREWRVEELRLKSNEDIHKLWFVLYKERNMLLTMLEESRDQIELFPSPERLEKVEQSMINIEEVVKERNKAYYELEVGNGETGMRPSVFRRDLFGIHKIHSCSQHLIPYWMNRKFRNLEGPGFGKEVNSFINKYHENKTRKRARRILEQWLYVRQVLRRFPDVNIEELKALYPKVPVEYLKENLDFFGEQRDIFYFGRKGAWKHKH